MRSESPDSWSPYRLPSDPLVSATLILAALSLLVWVLVLALGLNERPDDLDPGLAFKGYFDAINWWPFPVFFLAVAPLIYLTWGSFLKAWADLARTQVMQDRDGAPASDQAVASVMASLRRLRWWVILPAALATILINGLDFQTKGSVMFGSASFAEQRAHTCLELNAWNKWFVDAAQLNTESDCTGPGTADNLQQERIEPPLGDALFILATWGQQVIIVFVVAVAFGQILLHAILFWLFERWVPAARTHGLVLRMNAGSPVGEFGLERWNYALNNLYWATSPALLGVFLSRAAVSAEQYDPGQHILGFIVPICLLTPMVLSILSRQARLLYVWPKVGQEDGFPADMYGRQQLWPLDRNWSSKLGIIMAFILSALALGYEIKSLLIFT